MGRLIALNPPARALARAARIVVAVILCACPRAMGEAAEVDARAWMSQRGLVEGPDPARGRWATVVARTVPGPVSGADFVANRSNTFDQAVTEAKRKFAEYLGAQVSAEVDRHVESARLCGDSGPMAAISEGTKRWGRTEDFRKVLLVAADAATSGLLPCQTFESVEGDRARIAVVLVADPGLIGGSAGAATFDGLSPEAWFERIPDDVLCRTHGVRPRVLAPGRLGLIGFGQVLLSDPDEEADACDLAGKEAQRQLWSSMCEQVSAKSFVEVVARSEKADGVTARYSSESAFREDVQRRMAGSLPGGRQVGRRVAIDAASGRRVCVAAFVLDADVAPAAGAGGCPPVPENMRGAVRGVRGRGAGATRELALKAALMDAISQDGTKVEGNAVLGRQYEQAMRRTGEDVERIVRSSTSLDSTTRTFASGFVLSYAVVDERGEAPAIDLTVCANLVRFDPKDPRFGLPPTVAVLPVSVGRAEVGGQPAPPEPFGEVAAGILESALMDGGRFQVIDERTMPALQRVRRDISERADAGRVDEIELMKIGRELTADFVLVGRIDSVVFLGPAGVRPQRIEASHSASAALDYRLVNVADGTVSCRGSAPVVLKARDILQVRAGRDLQHPDEQARSPADLAVSRAARAAAAALGDCVARAFPRPAGNDAPVAPTVPRVLRVSAREVTIEAASPSVRVGARFAVVNLVDVRLPGGKVVSDRDRVATIEVTSLRDGLAKARVVDGDIDLISESSILEPPA